VPRHVPIAGLTAHACLSVIASICSNRANYAGKTMSWIVRARPEAVTLQTGRQDE
jgi:hypothetical protein